ncbi:uncharacterized protein DUF58 [Sphaerotilus hippei]|uniref:Uncharacterized protein DUF58 n=1 Tax=Sphaerotilus hippei TaxID=744406 RepID=A0A318HC94_9BURK|nr:DUF58 domain-containing protein [Sphaerotilus hippei]PXW98585.1 uncharacterized protein DUF58 [Sphaerotilus hippei]
MAKRPTRWRAWWEQRHPRTDTLRLTQRNVYILPTATGWCYGALLAVLLLASINYQLNLGHLLTFVLAGAGVVALQATHAVLRGLDVRLLAPLQGPAGGALPVRIRLQDPAPRRWPSPMRLGRHGLTLRWRDGAGEPVQVDVPDGQAAEVELAWSPARRGLQALPALTLESRFPLGLFRAWTVWRPATPAVVWPAPEIGAPPWPAQEGRPRPLSRAPATAAREPDEPDGVRPWRRGDSPRQVAWKSSARLLASGGGLLVRERPRPAADPRVHLRWADTPASLDPEARLSRLCAWVLMAERQRLPWRLDLPDGPPPSAPGPSTSADTPVTNPAPGRDAALHRLACWGLPAPGAAP